MDIFAKAARTKLRINTKRGELTVEQLWDLPMTSEKGLSLNEIGVGAQHALRDMGDFSLVDTNKPNAERKKATLILDIVKFIIETKKAENAAQAQAAGNKAEKEMLMGIISQKQEQALRDMSEDEIMKRIAALG